MIIGIKVDGNIDDLKNNDKYIALINKLENDTQEYLIGIDLPQRGFSDYTVICYFTTDKDKNLYFAGKEII